MGAVSYIIRLKLCRLDPDTNHPESMRKHESLPDLSLGKEGEGNVEPSPSRQREQMDHSLQCPRLQGIKWQKTSSC